MKSAVCWGSGHMVLWVKYWEISETVAVAQVNRLRWERGEGRSWGLIGTHVNGLDLGRDKPQEQQHSYRSSDMQIPEVLASLTLTRSTVSNVNGMFEEGKDGSCWEKCGGGERRSQGGRNKQRGEVTEGDLRKENASPTVFSQYRLAQFRTYVSSGHRLHSPV